MQPFKVPSGLFKSGHLGGLLQFATIGFSTRALVEALNGLGITPVSLDAFGDQDCRDRCSKAIVIEQWGTPPAVAQIVESLRELAQSDFNPTILYAGGIENWPELAQALDSQFHIMGPNAHQFQLLRCPENWETAAKCCQLRFPETNPSTPETKPGVPEGGENWLAKPYLGSGGIRVKRLSSKVSISRDFYCQQIVEGRVLGFQCSLGKSGSKLLGVTESWSARDWPGPTEYIYRGSWGPIGITALQRSQVLQLGDYFHETTGYVGWIGFDMIEDASSQLWLLEVNPRWTSGMEILCKAAMPSPVAAHFDEFQATGGASVPGVRPTEAAARRSLWGKAVLYASDDIELSRSLLQKLSETPFVRDVPSVHATRQGIQRGHPLLTLYAQTPIPSNADREPSSFVRERVLNQLRERYDQVQSWIG